MNGLVDPAHPAWQPLPGQEPIPLIKLTDKVCCWPVGGGFCGLPAKRRPGPAEAYFMWCPAHHTLGTVPRVPKKSKKR